MNALRKAAVLWLTLVLLGLLAWRESVPTPSPVRWPASVRVVAPRGGRFCSSRELQRALGERAFEWVSGPGREDARWGDAFELVCNEQDDASGGLLGGFELRSPRRREPLYSDAFAAPGPGSRQVRERLADEAAARLFADPAVAAEIERVFEEDQTALTGAGALAFTKGDWRDASRLLFQGLEGNDDPAPTYYGLSAAAARLGEPSRALWYALAYLKTRDGEVSPESLAFLKDLPAPQGPDAEAAGLYDEARRLIDQRQLRQALVILKLACERVPWDARPAQAVAELYDAAGFPSVAARWRARATLAHTIKADASLKAAFLSSLR